MRWNPSNVQVDLARGHVAALKHMDSMTGCVAYNLGTGVGFSVLDIVKVRP